MTNKLFGIAQAVKRLNVLESNIFFLLYYNDQAFLFSLVRRSRSRQYVSEANNNVSHFLNQSF